MKYCCETMNKQINHKCDQHSDPFDCPDNLMFYSPKFDEFGIIIHDGGPSYSLIAFCPWCGIKLPSSKRDLWFDVLEELGFDDPYEQLIPEEFKSEAWYKDKEIVEPIKSIIRRLLVKELNEMVFRFEMIEPPSFVIDDSVDNLIKEETKNGTKYRGILTLTYDLKDYYEKPYKGLQLNYFLDEDKNLRIIE